MEAIEVPGIGHEVLAFFLEHLPDGPIRLLGMAMRLGMGHAFVEQPGIQLVKALHTQAGREWTCPGFVPVF